MIKRYVREYASDKIKQFQELEKAFKADHTESIDRIKKVVRVTEKGLITNEEALREILSV